MSIIPVTAAGGVLYKLENNIAEVLLIYRRGVWDLPKGKLEPTETIEYCARREVAEEVGCSLPEISFELNETYHEYQEEGRTFGKTTHWFAMPAPRYDDFKPEKREGITKVAWYSPQMAKGKVGFDNLRSVLAVFEEKMKSKLKS